MINDKMFANNDVPHYIPKVLSPIYRYFKRLEARDEVLTKIKIGDFNYELAILYENLGGLSFDEVADIIEAWHKQAYDDFITAYKRPLEEGNIEEIRIADTYFNIRDLNQNRKRD